MGKVGQIYGDGRRFDLGWWEHNIHIRYHRNIHLKPM